MMASFKVRLEKVNAAICAQRGETGSFTEDHACTNEARLAATRDQIIQGWGDGQWYQGWHDQWYQGWHDQWYQGSAWTDKRTDGQ